MHPRRPWNAALATALALLLPALAPAVGAATDAVTNGTFASDTQGWTFTVAAGAPTGSWDAAGQANGGAAKTSSETGSQKTGTARWDQGLASIGAGATVTLSYAWKKGYEAKKPLKQDLAVRLLKPGGAVVVLDAQNGAPSAYDAWFTVNDKDVSAHFTETGVYTLQLQYAYKTGKHAQAKALAWFDEVRLLVGAPSGTWVERAPSPEPGAFGEAAP